MKQSKDTDKSKEKKQEDEKKKIIKTMRFTKKEYAQIQEEIDKFETNFSKYARAILLKKKLKYREKTKTEVAYQLNKIGNNINQIAKHANEKKAIDLQTLKMLDVIKQKLSKIS